MKLEWIEDILAVLETGSFSAAAERRYLTPSAFTRRVRSIEDTLGTALFDRNRKPVTLLPHVQNLEGDLREAARQFRQLRLGLSDTNGQLASRLSLGAQHALTAMVSPWVARVLRQHDNIALRIRSGSRSECLLMLLRREIDFALIYETVEDRLQFDAAPFDRLLLGQERLIPVAAPSLVPTLHAGSDIPLITYPADVYLGEMLHSHILPNIPKGLTFSRVAETGLTLAVLQFIRQGLGIGWLPHSVAHDLLQTGALCDLSRDLPNANMTIALLGPRAAGNALALSAWGHLTTAAPTIDIDGIETKGATSA
jgi:DNA-binding transcriptional LysR family regulator